jgi:hypothetical protein
MLTAQRELVGLPCRERRSPCFDQRIPVPLHPAHEWSRQADDREAVLPEIAFG